MKKVIFALAIMLSVFILNGCEGCSQSNPSSPDQTNNK